MTKSKNAKPWYSAFGGPYLGDHPSFYNREELPWTKTLEDNYTVFRDEFFQLLEEQQQSLKPYPSTLSFPPKKWKTLGLSFWKIVFHKNHARCPKTVEILKTIPNVVSFSLSVLEPHSTIKEHRGDTDAIIRCHLGLSIPATLPECGFRVADEQRSWEEGKTLPFCDAKHHTAWNNSDERRLIMIIDVMRPEFANWENRVCSRVLGSQILQMLKLKYPALKKPSLDFFRRILYRVSGAIAWLVLPFQRMSFR